jgi:hypothetical protein
VSGGGGAGYGVREVQLVWAGREAARINRMGSWGVREKQEAEAGWRWGS